MSGVRRVLYLVANVLGGVALVLLFLDPGRDLLPVDILLALAVLLAVLPHFLPPGRWPGGARKSCTSATRPSWR
jgi:hypothetical protein